MNETLVNLLARLREPGDNPLTDAELTELRDGLRAYAEELREADRTAENVQALQEVATAVGEVRAQTTARAEAAAELARQAEEALAAIAETDEVDEEEGAAGDQPADAPAADAPAEPAAADGDEPAVTVTDTPALPIAAAAVARPKLGQVAAPNRTPSRSAAPAARPGTRATATLTAAGDMPGFSAGDEIKSGWDFATSTAKKIRAIGPDGGQVMVASLTTEYPEERMLREGRDSDNERKYRDAVSPEAITAAGGICGPVSVDYAIPTFATAERPVRDALVRFGADRGGITFTPPPKLSDVAGAVGTWTEATDASPGGSTKAVLTLACGTPTTVLVDAITAQIKVGNMQGRFQPESVDANWQNALAAFARVADVNLLNKIHAASTEVTISPSVGAGRGILEVLDLAIAGTRYRMRLSDATRFRAILPIWARDMMRTDFLRELANDSDRIALADARIAQFFTQRNVNVSWHYDGVAASTTTGRTYPLQGFAAQSAGAVQGWPSQVVFPLFPEGSFQYLDGGELNLGVFRDSTLISTNDYGMFFESFENAAFRGVESDWVIATVAPTGASAGTVTPAWP